jgi:chaperonin GroES
MNVELSKLTMLPGKFLILQEAAKKIESIIELPDNILDKPCHGKVISAGKDEDGPEINAGDTVYFGHWSGTKLELNKVAYLVMTRPDIMLIGAR